jgi:hypothetical protein
MRATIKPALQTLNAIARFGLTTNGCSHSAIGQVRRTKLAIAVSYDGLCKEWGQRPPPLSLAALSLKKARLIEAKC